MNYKEIIVKDLSAETAGRATSVFIVFKRTGIHFTLKACEAFNVKEHLFLV